MATDLKADVERARQRADLLAKQARERIPAEYHDFLLFLDQNQVVAPFEANEPDKYGPGVWSRNGKTYLKIRLPYVAVDGRVRMLVDEHRKAEKKFKIAFFMESARLISSGMPREAVPEEIKNILTCEVQSEIYGASQGSSKISWGGDGVDRSNPYENAQTSALGRALGNMGYGLVGTGIASFEEVKQAIEEQERSADAPKPPAPSMPGPKPPARPPDAAPKPAEPKPPENPDDPALKTDSGPCADCGVELPKAAQNMIKNRRRKGEGLRWSHQSVPGLEGRGADGRCNNPLVSK